MKKVLAFSLVVIALMAGAAGAQMMGGGMMGGYQAPPQPQGYGMYPGAMMGYAYPNPMGPGMMGYGYPSMMGPGMMGYGMMGPGMMGYGYPSMMGPGMMGYGPTPCATYPGAPGCPGALGAAADKKFLDDTVDLRRKANELMFEHMELARDPKADPAKVEALVRQIQDIQKKIAEKWREAAK